VEWAHPSVDEWFTRNAKYKCVQEFSTLADAATDYLLFSLGKGRWTARK
jgi:hypothetical protein